VGRLIFLVCDIASVPVYKGKRIAIGWGAGNGSSEEKVMPTVIESSMFCCIIGRLILTHTNVGFKFVKVYGSVLFASHGDKNLF